MLAQDTPLLLLDEPANALDLAHQVSVMALLAKLCREQKKTVVMVGHDLTLAHGVSSHALLLMGDGRWLAGPVSEVMQPPVLSEFLQHPIEMVRHGSRTIFIPLETSA
jgi:iron complex transport system ATP-binding protein